MDHTTARTPQPRSLHGSHQVTFEWDSPDGRVVCVIHPPEPAAPPRIPQDFALETPPSHPHVQDPGIIPVASAFSRMLTEVLTGARAIGQLAALTNASTFDQLGSLHRSGQLTDLRCERVRVDDPSAGVIEAAAVYSWVPTTSTRRSPTTRRYLTLAFRLARPGDRWRCTALEIITGPSQRPRTAV